MLGLQNELLLSNEFHQKGIPLLISPLLLRSRMLGQVDLGRLTKERGEWCIELAEVKSSEIGEELLVRGQRKRLFSAQMFLSSLLGYRSKLIPLVGQKKIAQFQK